MENKQLKNKQNARYAKSWWNKGFFEKLNMLDKPLAKLSKAKRKEILTKLTYKGKCHNRY